MVRPPREPGPKGTKVFVDGDDARTGGGEEGPVDEDEAEGGAEGVNEGAALEGEDLGVGAAAVEAEDAGEMEVVGGGGGRRDGGGGHGFGGRGCGFFMFYDVDAGGEKGKRASGVLMASVCTVQCGSTRSGKVSGEKRIIH